MSMHKTKQTALISGAHGFLGYHLAKALKELEIDVVALPRAELYDLNKLMSFVNKHEPDYIFAFHAYGNHGMQKEEDKTVMSNYFGTWNLLKATSFINYKAFINVGTSSCYGHKVNQMHETDSLEPDTFYAATKAGALYLARAYAKQYGKPIATVMPFSVYGEGEANWRFIPTAIKNIVQKTTMPFVSKPTHDWIYVSDFIDGVLAVVDSIDKVKGTTINIGTGTAFNNREVLTHLEIISGQTCTVEENYQEQPHHSPLWIADNTKLKGLGWKQKISLHEGLKRCWDYYKIKYA